MKRKDSKHLNDIDSRKRILNDETDFDTVETYKSIRTNIMFSMPKTDEGKVIVITSSAPGEGKTTTSINLALTFAQMGASVLLVDCDLRKSRIHRYLDLERGDGVTNVLCGFSDFDKAVQRNIRENLDCLTSGDIPPNPAELLESPEFGRLLSEMKKKYDYIFIDTPPTTVVTDAMIVMRSCSGVAVVIRQDMTSYDLLDITMDNVAKAGAKMLGFIVLDADERSKKYYGKKGYYKKKYNYGYGYGYGYAVKEKTKSEEQV